MYKELKLQDKQIESLFRYKFIVYVNKIILHITKISYYRFSLFLLLLSLPLIIPFNIYRNIGLFIINSTSSIHGINENFFNENKYINVTHRFYNLLIIVINYINSFTIERDKLKINLSMFDYQKLNYRINLAKKEAKSTEQIKM